MLKRYALYLVVAIAAVSVGAIAANRDSIFGSSTTASTAPHRIEIATNGLHIQPWIKPDAPNFPRLLRTAAAEGKGVIALFEQRGCHFCAQLHAVNFAKPEITEFMADNFVVVQVDLWGERQVVNFDGARMPEAELARQWGVTGTPTTLVFAKNAGKVTSLAQAETFRLPGYMKPFYYVSTFQFLVSGAYERETFQTFMDNRVAALVAEGGNPDTW